MSKSLFLQITSLTSIILSFYILIGYFSIGLFQILILEDIIIRHKLCEDKYQGNKEMLKGCKERGRVWKRNDKYILIFPYPGGA